MTAILGSVRNIQEARLLLGAPIDILDLKNPERGALGAVNADIVRDIVTLTAGARPISAAAGAASDSGILERVADLSRCGVTFVKVGFGCDSEQMQLPSLRAAAESTVRLVAVLFADSPHLDPATWVEPTQQAGFTGLMLDTEDKQSGPLLQHMSPAAAQVFVRNCHQADLLCGLAGQLNAESAGAYLAARPDYLGFRGALCQQNVRTAPLCLEAIETLVGELKGLPMLTQPPPDKADCQQQQY